MLERGGKRGTYHERMDKRVKNTENPDGRGHILDARPHAKHSTGMVISLERGTLLPLRKNNHRIHHLIKLAQIKPIPIKRQSLLPQPPLPINPTQIPHALRKSILEHCGPGYGADHAHECPEGIHREKDIVEDYERLEGLGLRDSIRLSIRKVVGEVNARGVDGGDGERDGGVEDGFEPGGWDGEWGCGIGRGERGRAVGGVDEGGGRDEVRDGVEAEGGHFARS